MEKPRRDKVLIVRVTEDEKEEIKRIAEDNGYKGSSALIRNKVLGED